MSEALPLSRLMEAVGPLDGMLERASVEVPAPAEAESAEFLGALRTATLILDAPQPAAAVADLLIELDPEAAPAETEQPTPGARELTQLVEVDMARLAASLEHHAPAPDPELGSRDDGAGSGPGGEQRAITLEALAQRVTSTQTGPSPQTLAPADTAAGGNVASGPVGTGALGESGNAQDAATEHGDTSERSAERAPERPELPELPELRELPGLRGDGSRSGYPADDPRSTPAAQQTAAAAAAEASAPGAGEARPTHAATSRPDTSPQQQAAPETEVRTDSAARASAADFRPAFDSSFTESDDTGRETPRPPTTELAELGGRTGLRPSQDANSSATPHAQLASAPQAASATQDSAPAREPRALPELPAQNETAIIREARLLRQAGGGQARIQLEPPQLGELQLRVAVTQKNVTVSFVAEHAQIAELLARHLPELRQALEGMGLRIDNLELDARAANDEGDKFGSRGSAGDRETRDGLRQQLRGSNVEVLPPLPHVSPTSLGTVDVTI